MSNFWYNILDAAKDTSYNFPFMTWYDTIMTTLWQKPRAELHNPKEVPKSRAPNLYLVHVVIPSKSDLTGRNMKTDPSWALDEVPTGSIKGKFESFGFADLIIRTKTAQVRLELKQAGTSWQSSGSYLQPFLRANDIQHLNSTCCLFSTDSFSNCASYDFLQSESYICFWGNYIWVNWDSIRLRDFPKVCTPVTCRVRVWIQRFLIAKVLWSCYIISLSALHMIEKKTRQMNGIV